MTAIETYLQHSRERRFTPLERPAAPAHRVAILTCMDARIDPAAIFGLNPGDAHILRNAGGVVTADVIRSLAMSQNLLDTREVMIIQHTRCGMSMMDDQEIRDHIRSVTGTRPDFETHAFKDLTLSLKKAALQIRESPFLPETRSVRGFAFDVDTGIVTEVDV